MGRGRRFLWSIAKYCGWSLYTRAALPDRSVIDVYSAMALRNRVCHSPGRHWQSRGWAELSLRRYEEIHLRRFTTIVRGVAWLLVISLPMVLVAGLPARFEVRVVDDNGTPVEAVRVRVVRSRDRYDVVDLYTDISGHAAAELGGVHKSIDIELNGRSGVYRPEAFICPSRDNEPGLNYGTEQLCGLAYSRWSGETLTVVLKPRLPSRVICRLTGRGSATRPYTYAGQDSAITLALHNGDSKYDKLLWWFGDSVDEFGGWILVQNKLASSDATADASACVELTYEGDYRSAALPVAGDGVATEWDPNRVVAPQRRRLANGVAIEAEDTVWLDLPLLVPGPRHDDALEKFGQSVFQPDAGDTLYAVFLSVRDMPEMFRINHVGMAEYSNCYPSCANQLGPDSRMHRLDEPLWFGPAERSRAPEGSALVAGDDYLIFKVPSRRSYCAAPPYRVDCTVGVSCPDGSLCVEPGKFCSLPPYVACAVDGDCDDGECRPGGVAVMRVPRSRVLDKNSYRFWDARSRSFVADSGREPDAIVVDGELGNSVSIIWSSYLERWLMISNYNRDFFTGQIEVGLRTARSLMGPWSKAQTIMQNLAGQRSYNPRFVPAYVKAAPADNLVYWTATYSSYGEAEPTYGLPFDYNVFLYQTDLSGLADVLP